MDVHAMGLCFSNLIAQGGPGKEKVGENPTQHQIAPAPATWPVNTAARTEQPDERRVRATSDERANTQTTNKERNNLAGNFS